MFNILESLQELNNIVDDNVELSEVFEAHAELNPILFDDTDHLKDEIRIQLLKIADTFVESIQDDNIPIHVIDYWLLGSNAQYNYSKTSDIDVHVIVDTEVEDCTIAPYLLNLLYDYVKSNFNKKYDITVKGYSVELYLEDVKSSAVTNGIYSLKKDAWIKKPDKVEPRSYDVTTTQIWKDAYNKYLKLEDDECEEFLDDLHVMRKISLTTDGEWGDGNLVFKEFRNRGYIQDLKDRKYKVKSKELTLESLLNEQMLTEKQWIEAEASNGQTSYNFAFYATDRNPNVDLQTLMDIIDGSQTGTYKQGLDRSIVTYLQDMYTKRTAPFTLTMVRSLPSEPTGLPQITLTDRSLRKVASDLVDSLSLSLDEQMHLQKHGSSDVYIHHMDKNENNNNITNLFLVGYPYGNLGLAHAVHQLLHNGKPTGRTPITLTPGTKYCVPYLDCNTGHQGDVEFTVS